MQRACYSARTRSRSGERKPSCNSWLRLQRSSRHQSHTFFQTPRSMSSRRGTTPPAIKKQDLVKAANRLLGGLASLRIATNAGADDAFEYWMWARTLSVAQGMGLTVQIQEQQGGRVRLRTTPGTVTSGNYSYAEISSSTNQIELHTGVYVEGGSGANHEVDVVAIDKGAGRSNPLSHTS